MAAHRSFGQQMQYSSTCSILYGLQINILSRQYRYFTPKTMWFVVRKRSKYYTTILPRALWYDDNLTYGTSKYAFISQKYVQAVCFRIQFQMHKKFLWIFRFPSSTALTPGIIQIWRLIFVWERWKLGTGKQIEVCVTCDKVLPNDLTIFII